MCPDNTYKLIGTDLYSCDVEKDIGVLIDGKLSFDKHVGTKVNKANAMFWVFFLG